MFLIRIQGYEPTTKTLDEKDELVSSKIDHPPSGPRGFATIVMNSQEADSAAKLCVALRNACPDCGIMVVAIPGLDPDRMYLKYLFQL